MPDGDPFGPARENASVGECAAVLAAAFAREPATRWICGDSTAVRERWFAATLATQATLPGARRTVLADAGRGASAPVPPTAAAPRRTAAPIPVAAAVLTPPGAEPSARAATAWTLAALRHCGPRALLRTLRYLRVTEPQAPPGAWTLEFLGVAPQARGRGAGGRLLTHTVDTVPARDGIFLTTADPANEPFYAHHGFGVLSRTALGGLTVTAMWRPGRGGH
ncbi:GNAT family N-acetyltransferase [Streptomyces sp. NPDC093252]|uniref:GNAT family N-acetyltransferase n=1 Tax=Streptomyces sp. NPDC093252 TaxID=3154980 RepID=UPI0034348035